MSWTDDELRAYFQGKLSEHTSRRLEKELSGNEALELRMMDLDPLEKQFAGAQSSIASPSPSQMERWSELLIPTTQGYKMWHLASACIVGACFVGAWWWMEASAESSSWRTDVATYQAFYSEDTIASLDFDQITIDAQLSLIGDKVGFSKLHQIASSIDGLVLLRGQVLAYDGVPLGQLVFTAPDGQPVALCLIERDSQTAGNQIRMAKMSGLASASFDSAAHSWLLIGTDDASLINDIATQITRQLAIL